MADENQEKTFMQTLEESIKEIANTPEPEIEDDTVDEETGELNVLKSQENKGDDEEANKQSGDLPLATDDKSGDKKEDVKTTEEGTVEAAQVLSPEEEKKEAFKDPVRRRLWSQRENLRQEVSVVKGNLTAKTQELETVKGNYQILQDTVKNLHGKDPTDIALGVKIIEEMRIDTVGTLKKLLAEAISVGYKFEGITTGMDALIERRLAEQSTQANNSSVDYEAEANREVEEFYSRFPDAQRHDEVLADFVAAYPKVSLEEAYFAIKNMFVERGLDWEKPLAEQVTQATNQNTNNIQQQQKPLPNGGNNPVPVRQVETSSANTSMDDIIRASLRENGIL